MTSVALVMAVVGVRAEDVDIECSGVLVAGRDTRVALAHKGTTPAQWVVIGGEFGGYTVTAYEVEPGVVVLARDGRKFRIPLKEAKVVAAVIEAPEPIRKAILRNLRQLAAAADQYYLENGKMTATYDDLVGPKQYVKQLEKQAGEDYRQLKFEQGRDLTVKTADGATVSYRP